MLGKDLKKYHAEAVAHRNYGQTSFTFEEGAQRYRKDQERYRKEKGRELPTDPEHPDCLNYVDCSVCENVSRSWPTDMSEASTHWLLEIFDDGWWLIDRRYVCPNCFNDVVQDDAYYFVWMRYRRVARVPERFRSTIDAEDFDSHNLPKELEAWRSAWFDWDIETSDDEEVSHEAAIQST